MKHHFSKAHIVRTITIIFLLIVAGVEAAVLLRDIREHKQTRPTFHSTTVDVEPWMTFSYINTLYKLPSGLLETRLGIGDVRYPDLEVRRLAKDRNMDEQDLVGLVELVVKDYLRR